MNRVSIAGFALGVGVGATIALLLAPDSGEQVRQRLKTKAGEGAQYFDERASAIKASAAELVDKGKTSLRQARETLAEAADAGGRVYREVVNS